MLPDLIQAEDFYRTQHQIIFEAMVDLARQNQPLDPVTLAEALQARALLDKAGGPAYLGELTEGTTGVANVVAYAEIVRERAVLRQLIAAANKIAGLAFNTQGRPSDELVNVAEQEVFRISEGRVRDGGPKALTGLLADATERIEALFQTRNPITGISSGFDDLDKKTAGLQRGDMVVVAGRPSMGKTSFAMNIVEHAVMEQTGPVLVFSMEMPAEQLVMRMISSLGRIDQSRLRTGDLQPEDWDRFGGVVAQLKDKKLFVDDAPAPDAQRHPCPGASRVARTR